MTSALLEAVAEFATRHRLPPEEGTLFAGFSGGADSTALALCLHLLGIPFVAVCFEHGLRGRRGPADRDWCRDFCAARGVPFRSRSLDVLAEKRPGEGLEAAARRCRLAAWRDLCGPEDAVALGHHLDDALETLVLRMMRGCNATGLSALRPDRRLCGVRFLRPMLDLRRTDIERFLREQGLHDWREDDTNSDCAIRRNAVRHQALPCLRDIADTDKGLLRCLEALRDDADCLETLAHAEDERIGNRTRQLRSLHPALLARVLRYRAQEQCGTVPDISANTVARVKSDLPTTRPIRETVLPLGAELVLLLATDGTFSVKRREDLAVSLRTRNWNWRTHPELHLEDIGATLVATPITAPLLQELHDTRRDPTVEVFDRDSLPDTIEVRAWRDGDRLVPFGASHSAKIQDILIDAKVPKHRRRTVPLLGSEDTVFWVAGVRRAEFGRATADKPSVRIALHTE